jgi:hypothetical protein
LLILDDFLAALKLALSIRRIILVRCVSPLTIAHYPGGTRNETSNDIRRRCPDSLFAAAPAVSHARNYGDWDDHHVWHDAGWWHAHHTGWVWHYHPEWVEAYPNWRAVDGDWDEHHVWRDRGWWYDHHPEWVHKHHRDWARWRD